MATILIVDDEPNVREFIVKVLHRAGHQVVEAAQGVEALEQIRARRPDLVISDVLLPQMDGLELVRRLRQQSDTAQIPILMMSGVFQQDEVRSLTQACGVIDLIPKPSASADICQAVDRALRCSPPKEFLFSSTEFDENHARLLTDKITAKIKELEEEAAARRRMAERVRTLSARLLEVQESERRHLARELHDEIGQHLTGLQLVLDFGSNLSLQEAKAKLHQARAAVAILLGQVRQLAFDLRPAMLDHLGLLPALLWLFERYTSQTRVRVHFRHEGLNSRFAALTETTAYRLIQEALTNVARHAGVVEVAVRVWVQEGWLNVQVEDQGRGYDPATALASGTTTGLAGMEERVRLLDGTMQIDSMPGAGTHVMAQLPLTGS
jgi:signal transduction histidine kinase